MWHSIQIASPLFSHLKWEEVNRLLALSPLACGEVHRGNGHGDIYIPQMEVIITRYMQHEAGLFEVDDYYIDSLNSHCDQSGNSRGMIDDSSHLKLRNLFCGTLLMCAQSQNLDTLWRDIPKLLIILITTWPLGHICHMRSFPPWNTFSLSFWDRTLSLFPS